MSNTVLLFGQENEPPVPRSTIVKADLYPLVRWFTSQYWKNAFSLSVEQSTLKYQGAQISAYYYEYMRTYTDGYSSSKTFEVHPEYRFYLALKHCFYMGPYIKYSYTNEDDEDSINEVNFIQQEVGIGGLAGYQFFIKRHVAIDFSMGLGKTMSENIKVLRGSYDKTYASNLVDGFIAFRIGYRFIY